MTRKHFKMIANIVKNIEDRRTREWLLWTSLMLYAMKIHALTCLALLRYAAC